MNYHKNITTGSLYRTEEIKFSDGTPSLKVQRWNWDMKDWSGHIHNHERTRREIMNGTNIIPITEEQFRRNINE